MQLSGDLSKVSLANLIQLVRNGELSGKIGLLQGAKSATIYLKKGAIVHVESDSAVGKEALMELFLWVTGSFSFLEEELGEMRYTLNPYSADDATERLLKEGLAYVEQKRYLDQLRVGATTVLRSTENLRQAAPELLNEVRPILDRVDGRRYLGEIIAQSNLGRRDSVQIIWTLLTKGLVTVGDSAVPPDPERLELPPWVVARLKQDNAEISQAVIDMVIWVDRVKCWMYQVDADFSRIVGQLSQCADSSETEDFWQELQAEQADVNGPLFGERALEKTDESTPGENQSGARKPSAPWQKQQQQAKNKVVQPQPQSQPAPAEQRPRSVEF